MKHKSFHPALKRLFAGIMFVICAVSASAQAYYLNVYDKNGNRTKYLISEIDSVKLSYEKEPVAGLEYVDLGLSVKWASFNIGATNPYEPGDFFAYGETETKNTYTVQTYKFHNPDTINGYTKYNFHSKYGPVDYKYRLDMEDDAARVNWGSDWRMPTLEEMTELVDKCRWEWICDTVTKNFKGYKVTGPSGNYIFLPAAQYINGDPTANGYVGSGVASYLSSSLFPGETWHAAGLDIEFEEYEGQWWSDYSIMPEGRMFGEMIRPVYSWQTPENVSPITRFALLETAVTLSVGQRYELEFDMDSSAWAIPDMRVPKGLKYYGDTGIEAVLPGTYTIAINFGEFNAELTVTVPEPEIVAEAVDLGLSVKWATCNLGAESPYMYGYHYAWGETEPKSSFTIDNYKWFDVPSKKYTKYTFDTDYKTVLDTEDDAASKLWGGDWRIPTIDEIGELLNNCSWEFVQERGVYGYKVTSKVPGYTDKSIFLPAAGYNDGINTDYVGYYWSSQLSDPESVAYYLFFNYVGTLGYGNYYRYQGRSIRPVTLFDASDADSLMLDQTDLTLNVGDSYELSLMGKTASGKYIQVGGGVWSSDYEEVATVKDGVIVAEGAGVCNISVVVGNDTLTCSVTVYDPDAVEYVDLGLSVLWATRNVGAQKPEDIGGYYAWGESVQKSEYSSMTYSWYSGDSIKKYNIAPSKGEVDNKYRLDPEDDAARVIKGDGWRTPTREEFQELMDNCNWIPTVKNGVKGFQVISVVNNNSIFMPLAGEFWDSDTLGLGEYAYYYSNTLDLGIGSYSQAAYAVSMYIDASDYDCYEDTYSRRGGLPIRPVYSTDDYPQNVLEVSGIILDDHKLTIETGESFMPYAEVVEASGVEMHALWKSDNIAVARVADNGAVLGISEGQCNIIAYYGDYADTCVLTVVESVPLIEYVDLGLSVNWATCNIGASSPEYIGNYYAWGETETKSTFEWSNYKFADGPDFLMTKYCSKPEYGLNGFTDGLMTLTPDDDVAHVTWGGNWRMPTYEEFNELIQNCSFRWGYKNGMTGYTVTSKVEGYTDKSIFLPACQDEGQVFLWTSSVGINNNSFASLLYGNSLRYIIARCNGMPVRPVCSKNVPAEDPVVQTDVFTVKVKDYVDGQILNYVSPRIVADPDDADNKCIVVSTQPDPYADYSQEFFIVIDEELKLGYDVTISLRIKADRPQSAAQALQQYSPGQYKGAAPFKAPDIDTVWTYYEWTFPVTDLDITTYDLTLSKLDEGNNIYFDDINVVINKHEPVALPQDVALTDNFKVTVKDYINGQTEYYVSPRIVEDPDSAENKCIVVTTEPTTLAYSNYNQEFFLVLDEVPQGGNEITISMRIKADKPQEAAQALAQFGPGQYHSAAPFKAPAFDTVWTYYEWTFMAPYPGISTYDLTLTKLNEINNLYFDDISVRVVDTYQGGLKMDTTSMTVDAKDNVFRLKVQDKTGFDYTNFADWTSSDSSVAVVYSPGYMSIKSPGTTVISASFRGETVYCDVTIEPSSQITPSKGIYLKVKEYVDGVNQSQLSEPRIVTDPTDPMNKCVIVTSEPNPQSPYTTQFFIELGDNFRMIPGQIAVVKMRYRADKRQNASSVALDENLDYLGGSMGNFTMDTVWNERESRIEYINNCKYYVISLSDLDEGNNCYFDDISVDVIDGYKGGLRLTETRAVVYSGKKYYNIGAMDSTGYYCTKYAEWTSSDTTVAVMNANGQLKFKTTGYTTVTASFRGETASCIVRIVEDEPIQSDNFTILVREYVNGAVQENSAPRIVVDPSDSLNRYIVFNTNPNKDAEYNTQLFIILNDDVEIGQDQVAVVKMRVKADEAQSSPSVALDANFGYLGGAWQSNGYIEFGTRWSQVQKTAQYHDGLRMFALNLSALGSGNTLYFDDITVEIKDAE